MTTIVLRDKFPERGIHGMDTHKAPILDLNTQEGQAAFKRAMTSEKETVSMPAVTLPPRVAMGQDACAALNGFIKGVNFPFGFQVMGVMLPVKQVVLLQSGEFELLCDNRGQLCKIKVPNLSWLGMLLQR